MSGHAPFAVHPLVRKLDSICDLTDEVREAVAELPMRIMELKADQDIVREGDHTSRSCGLLEGLACSFKVTGQGKRQITALHIPGDIPDLQSLHLQRLDTSVATMEPCTVAFIQHEDLRRLCKGVPEATDAFWRATLIDSAIFREWTTNVGQRTALSRMAHLLCELVVRLRAVGFGEGDRFDVVITQTELADATGMSTVHTNRTLKELRARNLITWKGPALEILDWEALTLLGDFDPSYLHLKRRAGDTVKGSPIRTHSRDNPALINGSTMGPR